MAKNQNDIQEMPLTTNRPLSKKDLIDYLQRSDIPDDAECTLEFDDDGFYLHFYWSEDAGAFGQTAVTFDIEKDDLLRDIDFWRYNKKRQ